MKKPNIRGLLFMSVAVIFATASLQHDIGNSDSMGPGFYPLLLSVVLFICGLLTSFRTDKND